MTCIETAKEKVRDEVKELIIKARIGYRTYFGFCPKCDLSVIHIGQFLPFIKILTILYETISPMI